ncbi:MAG: DNA repair protein RadA [Clostridia bacterium]|nr:DNA repair protein RadA [Clostridia bacterium]
MAANSKVVYVCKECGYETAKWMGKCPSCNAWGSLEENVRLNKKSAAAPNTVNRAVSAKALSQIDITTEERFVTGIKELDRVLGGGIVKGSGVLLSGDPGIGKSTILLQICNALQNALNILYVSGEESAIQIKMRANRLGVQSDNLTIMTETDAQSISEYIFTYKPDLVMIDSIQTMQIAELTSSAGSIVQVRECTNLLLRTCKGLDIPLFIVGHVNKGGDIAGPKVMEHIVDTVLYFEGERNQSYRILRAIKNRFGSTNEIGVFEMGENGLREVENPSAMLLSGRLVDVSGDCITCVIEGTRPILAEVQGLVTTTGFGNPRRTATGYDYNRLNLLLAVLEKRIGLYFSNLDTYVNIVGGMHLYEPAADLAVAMSLVSGLRDIPIDQKTIAFGEIGLSGEIRSVPRVEARVNEAARLGFTKCILPKASLKQITNCPASIELIGVSTLTQALAYIR